MGPPVSSGKVTSGRVSGGLLYREGGCQGLARGPAPVGEGVGFGEARMDAAQKGGRAGSSQRPCRGTCAADLGLAVRASRRWAQTLAKAVNPSEWFKVGEGCPAPSAFHVEGLALGSVAVSGFIGLNCL